MTDSSRHSNRRAGYPRRPGANLFAAIALVAVAGCAFTDPYEKSGVWKPNGSNADNLALQVVHPTDLVLGRGSEFADGDTAAQAVDRLRRDKAKPVVSTSITSVGGSGGSAGGS